MIRSSIVSIWLGACALLAAAEVAASTRVSVVDVGDDNITISIGSSSGVRNGMRGYLLFRDTVDGEQLVERVARLTVTRVLERTSVASITLPKGVTVSRGMEVELVGELRPPAPDRPVVTPTAAPVSRPAWDRARAAIRQSSRYGGLAISEQSGLVPLGADRDSGLWEFAVEGTGTVPRFSGRRVTRSEGMAVVLVLLPGGNFRMGSNDGDEDERPVHGVRVAPFFMSKYELTQAQYRRLSGASPSRFSGDLRPVEKVSWGDSQSALGRVGLRLPSEAEWEYAARAGTTSRYACGDSESDLARCGWYRGNSGKRTHDVGEKAANGFGLHDVQGNVVEWVEDSWHDSYSGAPGDGVAWVSPGAPYRVYRGGGWSGDARYCRSAHRLRNSPGVRRNYIGVRPARSSR